MEQRFLKISEVCDRLGIGRTHAYNLINTGQLQQAKFGRCSRVTNASLEAFMAASTEREASDDGQ